MQPATAANAAMTPATVTTVPAPYDADTLQHALTAGPGLSPTEN